MLKLFWSISHTLKLQKEIQLKKWISGEQLKARAV